MANSDPYVAQPSSIRAAAHSRFFTALGRVSADEDVLTPLIALVGALRPERADDGPLAVSRLTTLCEAVETNEEFRLSLRGLLLQLFACKKQVSFFADSGILPNSGFFSELWRRLVQRILPAITDTASLRDCVNLIFHQHEDYVWLEAVPTTLKLRFWRALRMSEARDGAVLRVALGQLLTATDVLVTRIGAMGLEPELARLFPRLEEGDSPFLALTVETHQLSVSYRAYLNGGDVPADDERQLHVMIEQCRAVMAKVRAQAATVGTSLALTYLIRRLEQSLNRLDLIVRMLAMHHQPAEAGADRLPLVDLWVGLLGQAVQGEGMRGSVRGYVRRTIGLLALRVTDNASRTGEHYITSSRGEYFEMWRSAMGAGLIVGFMALLKIYMSKADTAPLGYALMYSMNYSLGFLLVYALHFTIATKQPAMTAATIAGAISEVRGRLGEVEKLATMLIDVIRSQFAAICGNIFIAMPTAMLIAFILAQLAGKPFIDAEKAHHLLVDISPTDSLALFYAAIAGFCLFLSGLISGYYDNLAAYERLRERIEATRWLHRMLGTDRLQRFAAYLDNNLGALAGNFFFGIMLGSMGTIGYMTGLPLDIRHVTFSAANVGFALVALDFNVDPALATKAFIGIGMIGFVNLSVSFALAMWVALRARGVRISLGQAGALGALLLARFRANWRQFFWPQTRKTDAP
jgi:site-specific recombinase